jgi:hypothetical protein
VASAAKLQFLSADSGQHFGFEKPLDQQHKADRGGSRTRVVIAMISEQG